MTGEIPAELGKLANLKQIGLEQNRLTGEIPTSLADLSNLQGLRLSGNQFTGCIPAGLEDVHEHDLATLGLPFCDCSTGNAVPDAGNNPGLVSDCEALLASRDTLARTATLNWSADRPIGEWDGVTLSGTRPERVGSLRLSHRELTGKIPVQLGNLSELRDLTLEAR